MVCSQNRWFIKLTLLQIILHTWIVKTIKFMKGNRDIITGIITTFYVLHFIPAVFANVNSTNSPVWSTDTPEQASCEPITEETLQQKNYKTPSCNAAGNSQCTFTCKQHFAINLRTSKLTLTCTNGTWDTDLPECEEVKCGQLRPAAWRNYRDDKCSERSVGTNCPLTCKDGYRTNSPTKGNARCVLSNSGTTASWNFDDAPTCEAIKCQPFALRDSHQHLNKYCTGTQPVASQCRIGCQANYRFSDAAFRDQSSITVSCQLDADRNTASWSRDPMETSCEEVKCRSKYVPVEKNYETLGCSEGHVDGSCRLTCKEGYIVASNSIEWTASCNFIANRISTAIWNLESAPVCEAIKCEPFALNRNHQYFIGHCTGTQPIASACRIGCRTNYRFSDPAFRDEWSMTVSCQLDADQNTASWSKNPMETSCEEVKCRSEHVPVEKNYETLQCSEGQVGGSCRLTCKEGYRIAHNSIGWTASCNFITNSRSTAVWDVFRAPVCGDITCEPIDSRMKNVMVVTCNRSIKGKCHISCRQFYKFASYWSSQDQVEATCSLSSSKLHAEWKTSHPRYPSYLQPIPQCVEILCPRTELKGNYARATCGERSVNSQCQIQCLNGFKFGNNKTEQNIICTLNKLKKTAFWSAPSCHQVRCEIITERSFGTPMDEYQQKIPTLSRDCIYGTVCTVSCARGYQFAVGKDRATLTCGTLSEKWESTPGDVGLCEPIIETRKNCQFWFSGTERRSETNAKKHCKDVLGGNAALAILKKSDWIASSRLLEPRLVGAYVKKKGYWNDGVRIKGSFQNRGTCVRLDNRKNLIPSTCDSKHKFICEKPPQGRNPCDDSKNCSGNGHCTPVGCSFLCKCQDMYYGRFCNKGPLTIGIANTSIAGQYEIELKNNADNYTGVFYFLVNGKEEWNVTLGPEDKENFNYNLEKPVMKYETYLSVEASLLERPVTVSECKRIPGLESLTNITNDECNGHVLNVSWPGFVDDALDSRPYSVYIKGKLIGSTRAGEWFQISELDPGRKTHVQVVPNVRGCGGLNIKKDYEKISFRTAKGPPNSPDVWAPKKAIGILPGQHCGINWTLKKNEKASGYKVKIVEFARSSKIMKGNESIFNIHLSNDTYNFTTKPNSVYNISVGTVALPICPDVPVNWSATVIGCTSETSGPDEIALPRLGVGLSSVTLMQVNERNGPVSCYFVVMKVSNTSSNSTEVTTSIDMLKQANSTIDVEDSYIAYAAARFDDKVTLQFGNGEITCCDINDVNGVCESLPERKRNKRATQNRGAVYGENYPLNPDLFYRHYVLVSTRSIDGGEPLFTASPLSQSWSIPINNAGNNTIAALIAVAIILVIALVFVGILVYRRKSSNPKQSPVQPRADPEPAEFIDLQDKPESIIDRELSGYAIRLGDLFQTINAKRKNDDMEFLGEFKGALPRAVNQCNLTRDIANLRVNQPKNRYKNIVPYDRSRVALKSIPGVEFSDYINASYVDGYSQPRKFIATQGPKLETVDEFWRMICEQKCRVIVMVTKLIEKLKVKCAQYWPDEAATYGDISVKLHETVSFGDFIQRRMTVTRSNETFDVTQYHFIAWPDHGIPTVTSSLLRFHEYAIDSQPLDAGPIVVHCSAGVGRTGTFIALDHLRDLIIESDEINIASVIGKMRTRRPDMVQTLEQYVFIHKLVLELYQFANSDRDVSEFNAAVQDSKSGESNTMNIEREFAQLDYFLPLDTEQEFAHKECNQQFNRNPAVLPYDHNLVFIQMQPNDKQTPYYNGSIVASYNASDRYIAAQNPDEMSFDLFWRMVLDNDVDVIVALGAEKGSGMISYWPELSQSQNYEIATVRTLEENEDNGLIERTFEVSNKSKKINVLQISYRGWPEHNAPSGSGAVLEIISKIEKRYQARSDQETRTTVVHCGDGSGRSGTFCAISNLMERLKNENRVDVFRAVKDLRDLRPGMVETKEQYEFCYHAVSEYLQLFDLYGNFQ